jgi:hypothetical protein
MSAAIRLALSIWRAPAESAIASESGVNSAISAVPESGTTLPWRRWIS